MMRRWCEPTCERRHPVDRLTVQRAIRVRVNAVELKIDEHRAKVGVIPLRAEPIERRVEELLPRPIGGPVAEELVEDGARPLDEPPGDSFEHRELVGKELIKRSDRRLRAFGDGFHRRRFEPRFGEHAGRRVEDGLDPFSTPLLRRNPTNTRALRRLHLTM